MNWFTVRPQAGNKNSRPPSVRSPAGAERLQRDDRQAGWSRVRAWRPVAASRPEANGLMADHNWRSHAACSAERNKQALRGAGLEKLRRNSRGAGLRATGRTNRLSSVDSPTEVNYTTASSETWNWRRKSAARLDCEAAVKTARLSDFKTASQLLT